jgi:hypothetical protein
VDKLQQRLLDMERQEEERGGGSEGREFAYALGEVRQTKLVDEALDVLARAKEGRPIPPENDVDKLQQRLLTMDRQVGGSKGQELALALGELRRTKLLAEASDVLAGAKEGRPVLDAEVAKLQQRLLDMQRQDELLGRGSEGRQLAYALGEVRRSTLVAEALDVLAGEKEGRHLPDADVAKLQQLLVGMQRQDELLGRGSEGLELATALAKLRR